VLSAQSSLKFTGFERVHVLEIYIEISQTITHITVLKMEAQAGTGFVELAWKSQSVHEAIDGRINGSRLRQFVITIVIFKKKVESESDAGSHGSHVSFGHQPLSFR
jgi:hypothetical protein